jgi:hypothetical protein
MFSLAKGDPDAAELVTRGLRGQLEDFCRIARERL